GSGAGAAGAGGGTAACRSGAATQSGRKANTTIATKTSATSAAPAKSGARLGRGPGPARLPAEGADLMPGLTGTMASSGRPLHASRSFIVLKGSGSDAALERLLAPRPFA